jgi:hypothetical protein
LQIGIPSTGSGQTLFDAAAQVIFGTKCPLVGIAQNKGKRLSEVDSSTTKMRVYDFEVEPHRTLERSGSRAVHYPNSAIHVNNSV